MAINKEKLDEVRKKIRKSIKDSDLIMENEPQSSGDPKKIFVPEEKEDKKHEKKR